MDYEDAGKVEGNVIGSYGTNKPDPSKAKNFIGIPTDELNLLIEEVRTDTFDIELQKQKRLNNVVSGILQGLGLGGNRES